LLYVVGDVDMKFVTAIMSAIVWGSGQVLNKQWLKGLAFFAVQVTFICVELFTGTLRALTVPEGAMDIGGNPFLHFRNFGFFTRSLWGIITLGEIPRESSATLIFDHSTMLLISGLIAIAILFVLFLVYILNIRDAYKTRKKIEEGERVSSINSIRLGLESNFEYISITPGLLLILFVSLLPIIFSFIVVFTNYNTNTIPPRNLVEWVGFQTFIDIVKLPIWSHTFVYLFVWTTIWAFTATFTAYTFGMIQAVIISSPLVRFKKIFRSIYILPWAIPGFVSVLTWRSALHPQGPINRFLVDLGFEAIPFLTDVNWARTALILVNIWLGFPYFMSLISGVMSTIDTDMYEAAQIDGANSPQIFRHITFPYLLAATAPQLIFSVTFNFNNFGLVFFLTGGGPGDPSLQFAGATDLLITWIYKLTLEQRMYNYAAAMSVFIFVILATVSAINLRRTRVFKED
jgi:arabinogalactan oligomer/maltooligosaccharide transport system permease protein